MSGVGIYFQRMKALPVISTPRWMRVWTRPVWRATLEEAGADMLEIVRGKWRPYIALTSRRQDSDVHTAFGGDR
jgi:hypothetical protein